MYLAFPKVVADWKKHHFWKRRIVKRVLYRYFLKYLKKIFFKLKKHVSSYLIKITNYFKTLQYNYTGKFYNYCPGKIIPETWLTFKSTRYNSIYIIWKGTQLFDIQKNLGFNRLMETAKFIIKCALPIKDSDFWNFF